MIKDFTVTKKLDSMMIRSLCIKEDWYTNGDCRSYEKLLNKYSEYRAMTNEDFLDIAEDIFSHSDVAEIMMNYDATKEEVLQMMIRKLYDTANTIIEF